MLEWQEEWSDQKTLRVTIYIPDRDMTGAKIDSDHWKASVCRLFAHMTGGATVIPNAQGVWLEGDMLIAENVSIVFCLIPVDTLACNISRIMNLVRAFKMEANQAAVALEIDSKMYLI